jgi:hypothetical protein
MEPSQTTDEKFALIGHFGRKMIMQLDKKFFVLNDLLPP